MRGGGDGHGAGLHRDQRGKQQQQQQVLEVRGLWGADHGQVRDETVRQLLARGVSVLLPVPRPSPEQLLLQGGQTLLQDRLREVKRVLSFNLTTNFDGRE